MAFTSAGSALSPSNFRDVIGGITGNAIFGKWSVTESAKGKNSIVDDFSWDNIEQKALGTDAIATFDAFMSFDFSKENQITEYPVEGGGFVSAMKVQKPSEYEVILVKNGMNFNAAMGQFLVDLNRFRDGIELVDVITPFKTYVGCNVYATKYSHLRDKYNNMLVVTLKIKEIQEGVVTSGGKPRASASASTKNTGTAAMSPVEKSIQTTNAAR